MKSVAKSFFSELCARTFKCNICGVVVKTARLSNSNLNRHMKNKHAGACEKAKQDEVQKTTTNPNPSLVPAARPTMKSDSPRANIITKKMIQFLGSCNIPVSVVEDAQFISFIAALDPTYRVPGRRSTRRSILVQGNLKKETLKRELQNLPPQAAVSITMDLWTSRKLLSYMGMTVHFVEPATASLRSELLAFRRFSGRHTSANILAAYQDIVEEFHIASRVAVLVTDGASNMLKAFRTDLPLAKGGEDNKEGDGSDDDEDDDEGDWDVETRLVEDVLEEEESELLPHRVSCAAHTLQLVVKDGIRNVSHGAISRSLTRLNAFVGAARKSTVAMELLSSNTVNLLAPNATRWSSQLRAVRSFLDLPAAVLSELLAVPSLSAKNPECDRALLEELSLVLGPFAAATDVLQAEKAVTASYLIPTIIGLRYKLKGSAGLKPAVEQLRHALLESLDRRFKVYEEDPHFVVATVLDPTLKLLPWLSEGDKCIHEIRRTCLNRIQMEVGCRPVARSAPAAHSRPGPTRAVELVTLDEDDPPSSSPAVEVSPGHRWGASASSLYSFMAPAAAKKVTARSSVEEELLKYLEEPALSSADVAPLQFWAAQAASFPLLEVVAKNFLSVPASSGPAERLFSVSGKLLTPARNRMNGELSEALMRLKC